MQENLSGERKKAMKWLRFMITTLTEAEDILVSDMYDIGLEGAQIEDKLPLTPLEKERMFVDILPEPEEDDGIAYLSFFVVCDFSFIKLVCVANSTPYRSKQVFFIFSRSAFFASLSMF